MGDKTAALHIGVAKLTDFTPL